MTKTVATKPRKPHPMRHAPSPVIHPHSVPTLDPEDGVDYGADGSFAEDARNGIDADMRQRMISERAFRMYCDRGGADGYDVDDWLEAEAEVDHLLVSQPDE